MNSLFETFVVKNASLFVVYAPVVICPKLAPNLFYAFLPGMNPQYPGTWARGFVAILISFFFLNQLGVLNAVDQL